MARETFADWLIRHGMQFHPDTVVIDATELCDLYYSGGETVYSWWNGPDDWYSRPDWQWPQNTTPPITFLPFKHMVLLGYDHARDHRFALYIEPELSASYRREVLDEWGTELIPTPFVVGLVDDGGVPSVDILIGSLFFNDDGTLQDVRSEGLPEYLREGRFKNAVAVRVIHNSLTPMENLHTVRFKGAITPKVAHTDPDTPDISIELFFSTADYIPILLLAMAHIHERRPVDFVEHSRQVRRHTKRKLGKEPSPYFLLRIGDNGPRKQSLGQRGSSGVALPQHVVRGHFRVNPPDHPIKQFAGKTFWISPHTKGDEKLGQITKGYKVVLPKDETA